MSLNGPPCILWPSELQFQELIKLFKNHSYMLSPSSAKGSYFSLFFLFHSAVAQEEETHRVLQGSQGVVLALWFGEAMGEFSSPI